MEKKKIKLKYINKIKLIKNLNKNYYDKNHSLVTDNEYDDLKNEILKLEKKYNFLTSKDSP